MATPRLPYQHPPVAVTGTPSSSERPPSRDVVLEVQPSPEEGSPVQQATTATATATTMSFLPSASASLQDLRPPGRRLSKGTPSTSVAGGDEAFGPHGTSVQPDHDDGSEDDGLSVLEEVLNGEQFQDHAAEQTRQDEAESGLLGDYKSLLRDWLLRFVKTLLLMAVFLVPTSICHVYAFDHCLVAGSSLLNFAGLICVAIFARFLAQLIVMVLMLVVKRTPVLGTQFLYYINNIHRPLKSTIVSVALRIAFHPLFGGISGTSFYTFMDIAISCITITAVATLLKNLCVRLLAIRYHRSAYYRRIKSSLFAEYVLHSLLTQKSRKTTLSAVLQAPISVFQQYIRGESAANSEPAADTNSSSATATNPADAKTPSGNDATFSKKPSWFARVFRPKAALQTVIKGPSETFIFDSIPVSEEELLDKPISIHKLAVLVEFIKRNTFQFNDEGFRLAMARILRARDLRTSLGTMSANASVESLPSLASGTKVEHLADISHVDGARLLASILFQQTKQADKEEVTADDFKRVMSPKVAVPGFALFDGNWDGSLTEREFVSTLLTISRERKALSTALNDGELAIDKLDTVLTGVLYVILPILYLILFGTDPTKFIVTLSSFLVATAFAIGNSIKTLLESIIFLFVTHPFDIGDRVLIDGNVVYTVSKMNLLTTQLKRFDNALFFMSNSVLATKPILNLRRSTDMFDLVTLQMSFQTPTSTLRQLEFRLKEFLYKHSRHYYRKYEVEYRELENTNRMVLRVWVQHRSNFQNMKRYRERRTRLILYLKRVCEELGIQYELPPQRTAASMAATANATGLGELFNGGQVPM